MSLHAAFRPATLTQIQEKTLLVWLHRRTSLLRLFTAVLREVCTYLGAVLQLLPNRVDKALCLFDADSRAWSCFPLRRSIRPFFGEALLTLDCSRVFSCGGECKRHTGVSRTEGFFTVRSAYLLHTSGEVDPLADMRCARTQHGAALHWNSVLVFGGLPHMGDDSSATKSCEEFSLLSGAWSPLPDMNVPRRDFTPCFWRREIYLCGGLNADSIEAFSPVRRSFRLVEIRLPGQSAAMSFVCEGQLLVMQKNRLTTIREDGEALGATVTLVNGASSLSTINPVLWKGRLYSSSYRVATSIDVATFREYQVFGIQ